MSKLNHGKIDSLNREMGEVKAEIQWIKRELTDTKNYIRSVSKKTWYILSGVILSILIQIMIIIISM